MKLINNRYRIEETMKTSDQLEGYVVEDLWNKGTHSFMRILDCEKHSELISYLTEHFLEISQIKHKNLLSSHQFGLIETINLKKTNTKLYFLITEKKECFSIANYKGKTSLNETLYIILDIMSVIDHIHFRGLTYQSLNPYNVFYSRGKDLKLASLASAIIIGKESYFDSDYEDFIAPEVIIDDRNINLKADYYSIGVMMKYLLFEDYLDDNSCFVKELGLSVEQEEFLTNIISNLTSREPSNRDIKLRVLKDRIIEFFKLDYKYDLVSERNNIFLKTKLIGMNDELNYILNLDEKMQENSNTLLGTIVKGYSGSGKTRFLNELAFRLKLGGREVYKIDVAENDFLGTVNISNLLKQIVSQAPVEITNKYKDDFSGLLPELRLSTEIRDIDLNQINEKYRIFNRISNFLLDISKENNIYIVIDHFENSSPIFLSFIDYLIKNMKVNKLFLIISFAERGSERAKIVDTLEHWCEKGYVNKIYTRNLTEEETGYLVKAILGISYVPKNFSSIIYRESRGNPSYVDFIINDLINRKELFINKNGNWESREDDYSDIDFPTDFCDTIKNQLDKYNSEYIEVIKAMSIFNTVLSKRILLSMLDLDTYTFDKIISHLIEDRIVEEKMVDWGFNYSLVNGELKRYVYSDMPEDEKRLLHDKASDIILNLYNNRNKGLLDELLFHLIKSDNENLALEIIFDEITELGNKYSINSINLYEKAFQIVKDKNHLDKLKILENLTDIFTLKGDIDKLIQYLDEYKTISLENNSLEHIIKSKYYESSLLLRQHKPEEVDKLIKSLEEISRGNNNPEGIIYTSLIKGRMALSSGNIYTDTTEKLLNEAIELSNKYNLKEHLGSIHTIIGYIDYIKGNTDKAINEYINAIQYYEDSENVFEVVKPINNLGLIYTELYGDIETGLTYYEQGLEVASKYGFAQLENTFLNNIGELYLNTLDYKKALEYIKKSQKLAEEINEYRLVFLSYINLGFIYLSTNQLDKAYESYKFLIKANDENPFFDDEINCQYYNFLGEFYYNFGDFNQALKYSYLASESSKGFNTKEYLRAESRIEFIKYKKDGELRQENIFNLINKYKDSGIVYESLKNILNFAKLCIYNNEKEFAKKLYDTFLEIKGDAESECIKYNSIIVELMLNNSPVSEIEKTMDDSTTCPELKVDISLHYYLGLKYYESKVYNKSLRQFLETLDYLYRAVRSIPDRDLKYNLIVSNNGDLIKGNIEKIYEEYYNIKISSSTLIDDSKMDYENYFDFSPLLDLLSKEEFDEIINSRKDSFKVKTLEELLINLGVNYNKNLELILDFICMETIAQRGFIITIDEANNMEIAASHPSSESYLPNERFLLHTIRNRGPILINSSSKDSGRNKFEDYLLEELTGVICVPINIYDNFTTFNVDRRKIDTTHNNKLIGYIYLETNKIFNRFDVERLKLICSISNLIYLNLENNNLKLISTTDNLTGVYTRKYFETRFENLLNNYKHTDNSFSLLMIDIDRFKIVNDTYGHLKGDEVLSYIGKTILENVRITDIVGRYGGEEFIVILQNTTVENGMEIGEKIRSKIEEIKVPGIDYPITVSIGMSTYPANSKFKEDLINKADQALYYAKEVLSRNKLVLWHEGMDKTYNSPDKVLGIITGNTIKDNRNILAIVDTAGLVTTTKCISKKIYEFLSRLLDIVDGEYASLLIVEDNEIQSKFCRKRKEIGWSESLNLNYEIIRRVIENKKGEYLIDWYNLATIDRMNENPNWQSVLIVPLMKYREVKGIVYITVPLKEKEFNVRSFNIVNLLSDIFTSNLDGKQQLIKNIGKSVLD